MRRAVRGSGLIVVAALLVPIVGSALTMRSAEVPELPTLPGTASEAALTAGVSVELSRTEIVLTLPQVLWELFATLPVLGGDGIGSLRPGWPERFEIALANFLAERPLLRRIMEGRNGSNSNDTPVVPEPATALLMLLGLAGLTRAGRPRRQA